MRLRQAGSMDAVAIARLERYCFAPEVAFGAAQWRGWLKRVNSLTWLVEDEAGKLLGYVCLSGHRGWRRLMVVALAVHWAHRRQGLAQQLLAAALAAAAYLPAPAKPWQSVSLEVASSNAAAQALYQRLGFTPVANLPDYYGLGQAGTRWLKPWPAT
ncbi:MAG: GNAT family N-acetyltransferase [Aeromonas sp.]